MRSADVGVPASPSYGLRRLRTRHLPHDSFFDLTHLQDARTTETQPQGPAPPALVRPGGMAGETSRVISSPVCNGPGCFGGVERCGRGV